MNSPMTQLVAPRRMGIYEPLDQFGSWGDPFKDDVGLNADAPMMIAPEVADLDKKFEYIPNESVENSRSDQEASKPDKVQRRLAQNREAARKSRLRKKAYLQQLESSRLKLAQLEQELLKTRQQGLYLSHGLDAGYGFSRTINSGIAAFEMEYGHWVEEQQRKISELRNALQAHVGDMELNMLVENNLKHYQDLFRMKGDAAKVDVFYLMSGTWRTSAERFFLWIGGFRPSELLNVVIPQIAPLTEQQEIVLCNLHQSSQQTEDALSQGMDKLQQTLAEEVATNQLGAGNFASQVAAAMEKLESLEDFVTQADHLRQSTMQHMSRILTTRQAARGFLALGEYFHRLRALSSLWAARPREPT